MFKPLGDLLPGALGRLRVQKPVEAITVCRVVDEAIAPLWDHAVPMRALSYKEGGVLIAVTSSAWAHEVSMKAEHIKEAANKALGGTVVSRIRTRVSPSAARGEDSRGLPGGF